VTRCQVGSKLDYETYVCELEDYVGEKGLSSNWPTKFGHAKKTPHASFPGLLLESV
jgi:hypothetical protein